MLNIGWSELLVILAIGAVAFWSEKIAGIGAGFWEVYQDIQTKYEKGFTG